MTLDAADFLRVLGVDATAGEAGQTALLHAVTAVPADTTDLPDVARAAILAEEEGIRAYQAGSLARDSFTQVFECLRLLKSFEGTVADIEPEILPQQLDLPFRLAVAGLLARSTAEVRLALADLVVAGTTVHAANAGDEPVSADWESRLLVDVFGAFILLVRKRDGWSDIDRALELLGDLRRVQRDLEPAYLSQAVQNGVGQLAALRLAALFHLARAVTLTGQYLVDGSLGQPAVLASIDRHHDQAREALAMVLAPGTGTLTRFADLLWAGCRELVRNSLWSHVEGLGDDIGAFARALTGRDRVNPVLELWPSQQEVLAGNIFDQYRRAVLVQMPTSAGKTLLAEFVIVQSRALRTTSTVAYVVPTRALVNQVSRDLRADLRPLGMTVEQAVPAYELDPAEESLLSDPPAVLVTTAEKLSLLLRREHPCLSDLGLVVVDEAHNLADGERGARLELLLATIRRDKPGARYLLLSPFLPDAQQLVDWLGGERGLPPITVNWRPSRRIVGTVSVAGRRPDRNLVLTTLDAVGNADVAGGRQTELMPVSDQDLTGAKTVKAVTRLAARRFRQRASTLILCWGTGTAMTRAAELAAEAAPLPADPFREAVRRYLRAEYGDEMPLADHIESGVAYHHGGMSQEARVLVESLVRRGLVHTICGTTTLAQGVNFPIGNVIIENRRKGRDGQLSYADLWNVIGRAGRTLLDDIGLVAFPVTRDDQADQWQDFMRGEAQVIASQLSQLIDRADEIGDVVGLRDVRLIPTLTDLLQFLAHAMRVGGARQTAAELEDLLRSSLVFQQARSEGVERADALVRLCRRYLEQVSEDAGRVALSDQTGFSTPTVGLLLASGNDDPTLADRASWEPGALFGDDIDALAARMRILGEVPELDLGSERQGAFSPERVATIVSEWVNGVSVNDLAARHWRHVADPARRVADFGKYLYRKLSYQASWGLGALEAAYLRPAADVAGSQAGYVPSMVHFGVATPQAVWMRMAGVPRIAAVGAGQSWLRDSGQAPSSFPQLREWLSGLDDRAWHGTVPGDALSGADMRRIWHEALA